VPLLSDLRLASDELNRFFTELGPFSKETLPSLRSLGKTGDIGRRAIEESDEEIRQLRRVAVDAGRVGKPLRQFLQTLDDRDRAVHEDTRVLNTDPPRFDRESLDNRRNRGLDTQGFTGMEAFLNYLFWQNLTISGFDSVGHFLRVAVIFDLGPGGCSPIATGEPDPETVERCNSYTGPKQPGVRAATGRINGHNFGGYDVDPTERPGEGGFSGATAPEASSEQAPAEDAGRSSAPPSGATGTDQTENAVKRALEARDPTGSLPEQTRRTLDDARRKVERAGGDARRGGADVKREARRSTGGARDTGSTGGDSGELLDFLLGP
jgi:hypothetical protein